MEAGKTAAPQFTTAEYAPNPSETKCAACQQPIGGAYFKVKGAAVCAAILELRDTVSGLIGLAILFVGIRLAWQFTAGRSLQTSGPFSAASTKAA